MSGDELLQMFNALGNPHRLRLYALVARAPSYVSQLARDIGLSRPLTHIHLQKLEKAGLIAGSLVLSEDGKAMKYFEVTDLNITLTPQLLAKAAQRIQQGDDEK